MRIYVKWSIIFSLHLVRWVMFQESTVLVESAYAKGNNDDINVSDVRNNTVTHNQIENESSEQNSYHSFRNSNREDLTNTVWRKDWSAYFPSKPSIFNPRPIEQPSRSFPYSTNQELSEKLPGTSNYRLEQMGHNSLWAQRGTQQESSLYSSNTTMMENERTREAENACTIKEQSSISELDTLISRLLHQELENLRILKNFQSIHLNFDNLHISSEDTEPSNRLLYNNATTQPNIQENANNHGMEEMPSCSNVHSHINANVNNKPEVFQRFRRTKESDDEVEEPNEEAQEFDDNESMDLVSEDYKPIFENNYINIFKNIVPCLKDIYECIKNINVDNERDRTRLLHLLNYYAKVLKPIEYHLMINPKTSKNTYFIKFFNRLENVYPLFYDSSSSCDSVVNILDTPVCMKLYIELVIYFSLTNLSKYKQQLKKIFVNKEEVLRILPRSGRKLPICISDLEKCLLSLTVKTQMKGILHKYQHFYLKIFDINDDCDSLNDYTSLVPSIPHLYDTISEIYQRLNSGMKTMLESRSKKIEHILNKYDQYEINGPVKSLKDLINEIKNEQEIIKTTIQKILRTPKATIYYVMLHLTFLSLHRLLASIYKQDENRKCISLLKKFLQTCESMLPKITVSGNIHDLNIAEKSLVLNDEHSIQYILKYIFLNILNFGLTEINQIYANFIHELRIYHKAGEKFLERSKFLRSLEKMQCMVESIRDIRQMLHGMDKEKHMIQVYVNIFYLREQINREINFALSLTKNCENIYVDEALHDKVASIYDYVLYLYKSFFTLVKNEIL